jgi:hypothetical protein
MARKLAVVCSLFALLAVCAGLAQAQSPYRVDYFSNANTSGAPDATLRLDNDGADSAANLCADIFVFDSNEEMSECCACLETPDGVRTLSVNTNLTSNPLTSRVLSSGVIKIVAATTSGGTCPVPTHITLVDGSAEIQSWATHIQNTSFAITEAASQVSNLSSTEESNLAKGCGAISKVGSGSGICNCGTGTGS